MDPELIAALKGGGQIVTGSARLARSVRHGYDAAQIAAGRRLWPEPHVLAWDDWIGELWMAGLPSAADPPYIATAAQEAALWQRIIAASQESAGETRALAAEAAQAWRLSHAWRITPGPATAETDAFAGWAAAMAAELETRYWVTAAELPDQLCGLLARGGIPGGAPGELLPLGFLTQTPQQKDLLAAWRAAGGTVREPAPAAAATVVAKRATFASEREEAEAAAAWARRQLEAGARRVAVVVLDGQRRRQELDRAFTLALAATAWLPGGGDGADAALRPAFHLTLGEPLADHPVIHAALRLLQALLPGMAIAAAEAEACIMSPYLPAAAVERTARGRVCLALSKTRQVEAGLGEWLRLARHPQRGAPQLAARLAAARRVADAWPPRQPAPEWADAFSAALKAAGWPGESLDSGEHQAAEKWSEVLEHCGRLEAVLPALTAEDALRELESIAAARIFQPEAAGEAVTVLTPEAAGGDDWEAVWVMGLEASAWPPAARLNPWLPAAAQRTAGVLLATPEAARQWADEVLAGLRAGAGEFVASYAPQGKAEAAAPSPLIAGWPLYGAATLAAWPRDLPLAVTEDIPDGALAMPGGENGGGIEVAGGSSVLTDQSQCPFRAFAHHRLGAEGFASPASGLDAGARGQLLHDVLSRVFQGLAGPNGEVTIPDAAECATRARNAAQAAVATAAAWPAMAALRTSAFADLETDRLARTVTEWLVNVEAPRDPFTVILTEKEMPGEIGGLRLHWRADRVDRLAGGATVILDFKSGGEHGPGDWAGDRPRDLQLPIYALLADPPPGAVAFARLKPGEMKFAGWAEAENLLPGCKPPRGVAWAEQVAAWRRVLEGFAAEYRAGRADVEPQPGACKNCNLPALCRVSELGTARNSGDDEDGDRDGD